VRVVCLELLTDWVAKLQAVLHIWPNLKKETQAPIVAFWSASISHAIGTGWGITALKYISYPAQVSLEKSCIVIN
jgi:hypothetical protein